MSFFLELINKILNADVFYPESFLRSYETVAVQMKPFRLFGTLKEVVKIRGFIFVPDEDLKAVVVAMFSLEAQGIICGGVPSAGSSMGCLP